MSTASIHPPSTASSDPPGGRPDSTVTTATSKLPVWAAAVEIGSAAILILACALKVSLDVTHATGASWERLNCVLEAVVATLLLSGRFRRRSWQAAAALFTAYFAYACFEILMGRTDCGCFGARPTSPKLMALLDGGLVIAFVSLLSLYRESAVSRWPRRMGLGTASVAAFFAWSVCFAADHGLSKTAPPAAVGPVVLHEPRTWSGHRLPVIEELSRQHPGLSTGEHVVLFYRAGCGPCVREMKRCDLLSRVLAERQSAVDVCLVGLPPFDPFERSPIGDDTRCKWLRVTSEVGASLSSPVLVFVKDSVVQYVPATAWERAAAAKGGHGD